MKLLTVLSVVLLAFATLAFEVSADAKFVGVKDCRKCHKKEKDGNQFGQWKASEHAKSYDSLGTDQAKKLAAQSGVKGDPQQAKACLVCHASPKFDDNGNERPKTAFMKNFKLEEGVQCEVCHGAGSNYKKNKTMKAITKEGGAGVSPLAKKTGLIKPDEALCLKCHVDKITIGGVQYVNPTYKGFDFAARYKEVDHPKPK